MLQSSKSIYEQDLLTVPEDESMITDANLYETNQIIHACFALVEMNREPLLAESPNQDGLEYAIRYYSYLKSSEDLIQTLNYTG